MNTPSINITRLKVQIALLAVLALALLPTIVFAHGGEEHVRGTVTKISDTSLTVKTPAGKTVEVGFDAKTTYARAKLPIQKTDVKVGDRIVIHAVEVNEKLIAHTVEVGAATTASKTK
ncbi:MAG TPA: DUF5666 domain-containing protein [Bryobacteraceae bacterium]|jgi:Domain of unknown function (DUF5666)|nr:DUF5666 domain-containing protein [Bryobacteraceae bacterium]